MASRNTLAVAALLQWKATDNCEYSKYTTPQGKKKVKRAQWKFLALELSDVVKQLGSYSSDSTLSLDKVKINRL